MNDPKRQYALSDHYVLFLNVFVANRVDLLNARGLGYNRYEPPSSTIKDLGQFRQFALGIFKREAFLKIEEARSP